MLDRLKFLRLVHLTLVSLSVTLMYASLGPQRSMRRMEQDIAGFKRVLAETSSPDPHLWRIDPGWHAALKAGLLEAFQNKMKRRFHYTLPDEDLYLLYSVSGGGRISSGQELGTIRRIAERTAFEVTLPDSHPLDAPEAEDVVREIQQWLEEACYAEHVVSVGIDWAKLRTSEQGPSTLDFKLRCVDNYGRFPSLEKTRFTIPIRTQGTVVTLPDDWLNRFPEVFRYWEKLRYLRLSDLDDWSRTERLRRSPESVSVLGLALRSSDLGVAGALLLIGIGLYLAAALSDTLRVFPSVSPEMDFNPWLEAGWGGLPAVISWLTIVLLPSAAGYVLLREVENQLRLASVLQVAVGFWSYWSTRKLAGFLELLRSARLEESNRDGKAAGGEILRYAELLERGSTGEAATRANTTSESPEDPEAAARTICTSVPQDRELGSDSGDGNAKK